MRLSVFFDKAIAIFVALLKERLCLRDGFILLSLAAKLETQQEFDGKEVNLFFCQINLHFPYLKHKIYSEGLLAKASEISWLLASN